MDFFMLAIAAKTLAASPGSGIASALVRFADIHEPNTWYIKALPFPAPQGAPPEKNSDHQAAPGPEPNGSAAPEPDKIAVCEGNVNFDMHTGLGCTELVAEPHLARHMARDFNALSD